MRGTRAAILLALGIYFCGFAAHASHMQIGDKWDRATIKPKKLNKYSAAIQKLASATGLVLMDDDSTHRGTAFYVGKHFGKYLFMTNSHVLKGNCRNSKVTIFDQNSKSQIFYCKEILVDLHHDQESDLALFSVKVPDKKAHVFYGKELIIDWNYETISRTPLATVGFGLKNLPSGPSRDFLFSRFSMTGEDSKDCMIMSPGGIYTMKANARVRFTYTTGCDVAGGDSGSAVLNVESGKVIGVFFAINIVKDSLSSREVQEIAGTSDSRVWSHSSLAIGIANMKESFEAHFQY